MKIELLVQGKKFPMILKAFPVLKGEAFLNVNAPVLTFSESARLDAHLNDISKFHDIFSDAVTYLYLEGSETSGYLGEYENAVTYQILLNDAPVDYSTLTAAIK